MEKIIDTPIIGEVEQSFLDYSLSVITDRAIPSAEDGLKPVARRILWDMFDKGYTHNKKPVKCAQPVGDTMGRFHPHGDSSIYGALVWLSQPWNMRYPLIAFHGNNGSRDGDEPAAYRYTECKLSEMGEEMLRSIKKNTVDWQPAYTDEEEEPTYLPGSIPNLIVNGTSGIAVAMACSFAPHNLTEVMNAAVHVLNNPTCNPREVINFITGPDFPTGGLIVNKDELAAAYTTGKGRARIRGEYTIETKQGKDSIVFTSIPYKVSKEKLIVDIDKLCEDNEIEGVTAIRDESNHEGVRFVIELAKGVSSAPVIAKLFKSTDLETTYSFNQVALVDKKPQLLNMKELLEIYISHQKDVLIRETNFDLAKIKIRLHILEGLLIALADIDNVIALIKKAESSAVAKTALMAAYNLTEAQAKAILDIKLSRLAHLERLELEQEQKDLLLKSEELNEILKNPNPTLAARFETIKVAYGDARRSTIIQIATADKEEQEIEFVEPEKCVVIMTKSGLIKRVPSSSFRTQRRNGKGVKNQDEIISCVIRTNTIDSLMVFSNAGKMYRLLVNDIPVGTNTSQGVSIKSLVTMETNETPETIYSIYRETDAKYVLFATKNGILKKTPLEEYLQTKKKSGLSAITVKEGDSLVSVSLIKDEDIIIVTANGMVLRTNSSEVAPSGRTTMGNRAINLGANDYIIAALPIRNPADNLAVFTENGTGKKLVLTDFPVQKRGGKGLMCYKPTEIAGPLAAATLIADEDTLLVAGTPASICIAATDVPLLSRPAVGNLIVKGSKITSVSKI